MIQSYDSSQNDKAKNIKATSLRLFQLFSPWLILIIVALFLVIMGTVLQSWAPKISGQATTIIYNGLKAKKLNGDYNIDFNSIIVILIKVVVMYGVYAVATFLQQIIMIYVSQKSVFTLRQEFRSKMDRLPIAYFDSHSNGDIMSREMNDVDNIASSLQQNVTQLITSVVQIITVTVMMLSISLELSLIIFITLPLSLIAAKYIFPKSQKLFKEQLNSLGLLNNQVEESYAGHSIIQVFNHEQVTLEKFEKENEKMYVSGWKAQFLSGIIFPFMTFVKNLGYVAVAVVGGMMVAAQTIVLGNVQAMLQYVSQFSQPITQISNLLNSIQSTLASAERVFEVMDELEMENSFIDIPNIKETQFIIEFTNVYFGYSSEKTVMNDFSFEVKVGETVAIVGPTGAGKTTLINLLERFYDIDSGSIKLRGIDIRKMEREELRYHFALVLQDTWLFSGSIFDNIAYGGINPSKTEVEIAAQMAHAEEFILDLAEGYNTLINESASNISEGQRQLITIARAFLANPEILILDEATSSVDTRTEIQIQDAVNKLSEQRTSFIVAHRLSTIRDADKILVVNDGQIIEVGTHESLMEKNGFYANLYDSQFINVK